MFGNLVSKDDAVKKVFDHFRNIGIAGAVFAAGIWTHNHEAPGFWGFMRWPCSFALCTLGVFLLIVAERHGYKQYREANLPLFLDLVVRLVYGLALLSLFGIAAMRIDLH